jgi:hypothetical protein
MRRTSVAAAAALAAVLACGEVTTSLESTRDAAAHTAGDTASAGAPASVRVTGQVLGVSATEPVSGTNDTLRFAPIPHARITLKRNILVDGQSAQEPAGELSADADGRFRLDGLVGGYYVVEAVAPGSGYRAGWEYLAATRSAVDLTVYLWKE